MATVDHTTVYNQYVRECSILKMGNSPVMEWIKVRECYFRCLLSFLTSVIGYIICNQLFIRGRETSENCLNVYLKGWLCYSARLWKDKIDFRESVRRDWHHFRMGRLQCFLSDLLFATCCLCGGGRLKKCLEVYLKGWLCYFARLWKDKIDFRESVQCDWHYFKSGRLQFLCQRVSNFKDWKLTSGGLDKSGIVLFHLSLYFLIYVIGYVFCNGDIYWLLRSAVG